MRFNDLKSKLGVLASMELLDIPDNHKAVYSEFSAEHIHLMNMQVDQFKQYSVTEQSVILAIYDIYFRNGNPIISDNLYDGFFEAYEIATGAKQVVLFEPSISAWEQAEHKLPMGSLSKCTSIEEIDKWLRKSVVKGTEKLLSEKLDGISCELIYECGHFKQAITRGNGMVGDDITENAKYFDGIVKTLSDPFDCSIRGELIITKDNFEILNELLQSLNKPVMKNTRNAVASQATKFKDRNIEVLNLITFIGYEIQIFNLEERGADVA